MLTIDSKGKTTKKALIIEGGNKRTEYNSGVYEKNRTVLYMYKMVKFNYKFGRLSIN